MQAFRQVEGPSGEVRSGKELARFVGNRSRHRAMSERVDHAKKRGFWFGPNNHGVTTKILPQLRHADVKERQFQSRTSTSTFVPFGPVVM